MSWIGRRLATWCALLSRVVSSRIRPTSDRRTAIASQVNKANVSLPCQPASSLRISIFGSVRSLANCRRHIAICATLVHNDSNCRRVELNSNSIPVPRTQFVAQHSVVSVGVAFEAQVQFERQSTALQRRQTHKARVAMRSTVAVVSCSLHSVARNCYCTDKQANKTSLAADRRQGHRRALMTQSQLVTLSLSLSSHDNETTLCTTVDTSAKRVVCVSICLLVCHLDREALWIAVKMSRLRCRLQQLGA